MTLEYVAHFDVLKTPKGLLALDGRFLAHLKALDQHLHDTLLTYREAARPFAREDVSRLIIACAPIFEGFLAELFQIDDALRALRLATVSDAPLFVFKSWFVQKQARRRLNKHEDLPEFELLDQWLNGAVIDAGFVSDDRELNIAHFAVEALKNQEANAENIEQLTQWCVQALCTKTGQQAVSGWVSFKLPQRLDYEQLVPLEAASDGLEKQHGPEKNWRQRDGFGLTDARMSRREVMSEIDYCVYCHKNDDDFCSKGFPVKKKNPELGLKINPLGEPLTGCPLEEKISEMHFLKQEGWVIAPLAVVMIDNPMCPATGHRICNDCMKACIYQKQDPVNIPEVETRVLTDVLSLPWGVELYDLLTRWNPLRQTQWCARPYNGLKMLVMGMGPAGFTMAHHLLMAGCAVVGADGLKIEPLSQSYLDQPIKHYSDLIEHLDDRVMAGFGGVAEYGITSRWDKNFLKLIYITLMRRPHFQVFGNVRFGGTVTVPDVWALGFDHLVLAVGAGLPKELHIPGSLAPGMRQANDFLMALQLTGAAKKESVANLQVRLPAVVIGGGLTGVDTATEVQAYYIRQVEKTWQRYQVLVEASGEKKVRAHFDAHSLFVLDEFVAHGKAVLEERRCAEKENRAPNFLSLIHAWGGVSIVYRRRMQDSPAYKRNHEEVIEALDEGIFYIENNEPVDMLLDDAGHAKALLCEHRDTKAQKEIPARSVFVATGAKPNVAYEFEHRSTFRRTRFQYHTYEQTESGLQPVDVGAHVKTPSFGAFTSYKDHDHRVSFVGDTHPLFHGSVVKAIASALRTYPKVLELFDGRVSAIADHNEYQTFAARMQAQFCAHVVSTEALHTDLLKLIFHAPMATKNFMPGQFYRVQAFESGDTLSGEAVALLGSTVDKEKGTITCYVIQKGVSTRLLSQLVPGQAVALMGPTGVRASAPKDQENILLICDRLGLAQVLGQAPALRALGNRVFCVVSSEDKQTLYALDELAAGADHVAIVAPDDLQGTLASLATEQIDRIQIIGEPALVKRVQALRNRVFDDLFPHRPPVTASVFGPMQCMLKGVCAQCLTWQIDPDTGVRTKAVFACSWQHQPLEIVDLHNLDERLVQNRTQEILSRLWLENSALV